MKSSRSSGVFKQEPAGVPSTVFFHNQQKYWATGNEQRQIEDLSGRHLKAMKTVHPRIGYGEGEECETTESRRILVELWNLYAILAKKAQ